MKDLGIIAWALFLSYLFFHDYFWWIWGITLAVGIGLGIRQIIKQKQEECDAKERREREIEALERRIRQLKRQG